MTGDDRAALTVVAGGTTLAAADGIEQVIARIRAEEPATAVVHHDLRGVHRGVVRRRLRLESADHTSDLQLAHGCVSCTLRDDVLPLLRELARRGIPRLVLHLDPVMEPEQVCWNVLNVLVDGSPITDAVDLHGVITVLDVGSWLEEATSTDDPAQRGLALLPDDERTIAHLVVGQAEFADLLVCAGTAEPWQLLRTDAALARLAPLASRVMLGRQAPRWMLPGLDRRVMLDELPYGARRGRLDSTHAVLLRGQPPLHSDGGVQLMVFTARRPFHPDRLHRAIDVLLDGVIRIRGRIWLATRPRAALWIESAGGSLQIGYAGDWLAAGDADAWEQADPERLAAASLRWHHRWGDRIQEASILISGADPDVIDGGLRDALLTDLELATGENAWRYYPDPFGWSHTDPCGQITPQRVLGQRRQDDA